MDTKRTSMYGTLMGILLLTVAGWPVACGADELGELKQQLEDQKTRSAELEDRINQLEARQKLKERSMSEEIAALKDSQGEKSPTNLQAYWKDGLRFKTADDLFQLRIGGRMMFDWLWIGEDDDIKAGIGEQEDGVGFRRVRFYMGGSIYENVDYMLQLDFAGGGTALKDAYIGLTDFPLGKLRMGQFKEPFSLEELTSSNYMTFVERAVPNAFAPSRSVGFMLHDVALDSRMTWAAGLFRDTDDTGFDMDDGGYNLTGRITGLPWYKDEGESLLHLGVAYSHRNPDETVRYRARPEAPMIDRFVDTGTTDADRATLLGLEAAWVAGPVSLQTEYMRADADRTGGSDVDFSAYYAQASYFLTGERRPYSTSSGTFGLVKPKTNFRFGGGPGAWELKARYSSIDLNDKDLRGGELDNFSAGVNWYLNPNMRIMWDYIRTDVDDMGQADILLMRLHAFF
ncbi:MAG: porin [Planctomycetota bacterium]|nr:porin [Planctomycetota bacterium]